MLNWEECGMKRLKVVSQSGRIEDMHENVKTGLQAEIRTQYFSNETQECQRLNCDGARIVQGLYRFLPHPFKITQQS
jgi:hypothetical protein